MNKILLIIYLAGLLLVCLVGHRIIAGYDRVMEARTNQVNLLLENLK